MLMDGGKTCRYRKRQLVVNIQRVVFLMQEAGFCLQYYVFFLQYFECFLQYFMCFLQYFMCFLQYFMCFLQYFMCFLQYFMCFLQYFMCFLQYSVCFLQYSVCFLQYSMCFLSYSVCFLQYFMCFLQYFMCFLQYSVCFLSYFMCFLQYSVCFLQYFMCFLQYSVCFLQYFMCFLQYSVCFLQYSMCFLHYSYSMCFLQYSMCFLHQYFMCFLQYFMCFLQYFMCFLQYSVCFLQYFMCFLQYFMCFLHQYFMCFLQYSVCFLQYFMCFLQYFMCFLQYSVCFLQYSMCFLSYSMCFLQYFMCFLQYSVCFLQYSMCFLSYSMCFLQYSMCFLQYSVCLLRVFPLMQQKQQLEKETGLKIVEAGVSDRGSLTEIPVVKTTRVESGQFLFLSVLCMIFILVALLVSTTFFCLRQRSHLRLKEKLSSLGTDTSTDATATYQELCRQRMAIRTSERVERPETLRNSRLNSVSSQFSDGPAASPSTRSSTSSWCEEPSYMEDHLKNKNRLEREWEALCSYQAEPGAWSVGHGEQNSRKNRSDAVVVYDHSRITLKAENNHGNSDYINASPIMDHDPRNPTYISSQGPLLSTVADFWQMVWESGCVVVVMLTPLSENGVKQCHPYWPDEGSDVYHIYEVNLVSEHIWCEDFLVRSFYLKNLQTNETRTVTQFHFLSWMDRGIPNSARTLLDFRSDGASRSGTYILIDMVLNRMAK
ncbi:Receptor-type tyrosine-protein phosphatase N2, partial [Dissostichus eleginoides]